MENKININTPIKLSVSTHIYGSEVEETITLEQYGFDGDIEDEMEVEKFLNECLDNFVNDNSYRSWEVVEEDEQ